MPEQRRVTKKLVLQQLKANVLSYRQTKNDLFKMQNVFILQQSYDVYKIFNGKEYRRYWQKYVVSLYKRK